MVKRKENSKSSRNNRIIAGIVLVAIVLAFIGILGLSGEFKQPYFIAPTTEKNCREVQEPYSVEECKQVPYQVQKSYQYYPESRIIGTLEKDTKWDLKLGYYAKGNVKLKNVDNEADWFTVIFNWKTLEDTHTQPVRHYIEPDEIIDFESIYDIQASGDLSPEDYTYTIDVNPDPITKTKMVTRQRKECNTVTKYRTVEKCD